MKGLRPLSVGVLLALMTLLVTVAFGGYNIGYRSGERNIPSTPTPNLQWGGPEGSGLASWLLGLR